MKSNRIINAESLVRISFYGTMVAFSLLIISSCSVSKKIHKEATQFLFKDSIISTGHIGISIFEPATNNYWYQYNATKYFVPASNIKLFTAYTALKYLGDSLIGIRYQQNDTTLLIYPTGDPTFLHPDFKQQTVYNFLKDKDSITYVTQHFTENIGQGWAWDDYLDKYMVQRSEMPMYGNLISVSRNGNTIPKIITLKTIKNTEYNNNFNHSLLRKWDSNDLLFSPILKDSLLDNFEIPMVENWFDIPSFLQDTLHKKITLADKNLIINKEKKVHVIYSQPTDSLLKPMLFNSDNFLAEQSLLMVSNEQLGFMSTATIIDTLLKTIFKDMPQKPRWVDGSGLSRYNLFTPSSFIYILNKMKNEFGIERLTRLLPTSGQGTLKNYYPNDSTFIFAKTGSMSNHSAISGTLYTKKGKLLIFSILADQFMGSATKVRHAVEIFLDVIRAKY